MAKTAQSNKSIPFGPQIRNNALHARSNTFYVVSLPLPYKAPQHRGIAVVQATWVPQPIHGQAVNSEHVTAAIQGYALRDEERVVQFLCTHAHILPLLIEAREHIRQYFPDSPLVLEVADDPESTDSQLVAIIIVSSSPDEVADRLEQFDRAWWLGAVRRARGDLCITVEFA